MRTGAFWMRMWSDFHAAKLRYSLCTHVRVLYRIMLAVRILVVRMCKEYNASGGRDVNGLQINNEQNSQVEKSSV